jgi:hypothetical protein
LKDWSLAPARTARATVTNRVAPSETIKLLDHNLVSAKFVGNPPCCNWRTSPYWMCSLLPRLRGRVIKSQAKIDHCLKNRIRLTGCTKTVIIATRFVISIVRFFERTHDVTSLVRNFFPDCRTNLR